MNTRIINRRSLIGGSLALALARFVAPLDVSAQVEEPYGPGTPADQATTDAVIAFVNSFVDRLNAGDVSVVNLANANGMGFFLTQDYYEAIVNVESMLNPDPAQRAFSPTTIYDIGEVLVHPVPVDGMQVVSARVTFSGYAPAGWATLQTERWYFLYDGAGSFILHDYSFPELFVPESLTTSVVQLTLSNEGLTLSTSEVEAADVVIFEVTNTGTTWNTTGIYNLTSTGETPQDVQARLSGDLQNFLGYMGKTPMEPGQVRTFAFFLIPGTYLVQQFSLSEDGFDVTGVLTGETNYAILEVAGK